MSAKSIFFASKQGNYSLPNYADSAADGLAICYDESAQACGFNYPVVAFASSSSGTAVTLTETGGTGTIDTVWGDCFVQTLPGGKTLVDVVLVGDISGANPLSGGGVELVATLPADLTADPTLTTAAGVAFVTDLDGPVMCIVRVSGTELSITRTVGAWAAGAGTFQSIHISYVHP